MRMFAASVVLHSVRIIFRGALYCLPLLLTNNAQREAFENPKPPDIWPEVGSRAMQRLVVGTDVSPSGWLNVQPGRYRFHATQGGGVSVRIVIHEYLAYHVLSEYCGMMPDISFHRKSTRSINAAKST